MRSIVASAWLAIGVLFCAHARAADPDRNAYDEAIAQALEHYRARDWEGARTGFERAHALAPSARTWRGLGLSAYYGRDYVAAAVALGHALADPAQPLSAEQRAQVSQLLDRVYPHIARVRANIWPSEASLAIDHERVRDGQLLPLAPGPCHIEATLPGYVSHVEETELVAGQLLDLRIQLAAEPMASVTPQAASALPVQTPVLRESTSRRNQVLPWIAAGATLALAIAASGFALMGSHELDGLQQRCREQGCSAETRAALWKQSPIETYQLATNGALAAAMAGAVTTVTLFVLVSPGSSEPRTRSEASQRLALGVGVAGEF